MCVFKYEVAALVTFKRKLLGPKNTRFFQIIILIVYQQFNNRFLEGKILRWKTMSFKGGMKVEKEKEEGLAFQDGRGSTYKETPCE